MARLDQDALMARAVELLSATPDESGSADLVCERGNVIVAADPKMFKDAFKRAKKMTGYKWVMINKSDLMAANMPSIGSKAGILAEDGSVLKNADIPRKKV